MRTYSPGMRQFVTEFFWNLFKDPVCGIGWGEETESDPNV